MSADEPIEALTRAVCAGDRGAIEQLYRRYFDWLYAQSRRASGRDESFCLDVVQDAVLRVVRLVRPINCERQLLAWMRLVVQATALDHLRAEARRRRREAHAAEYVSTGSPCDLGELDWLKREIAALDPKLVELIELRYWRGWTLRDIASHLGMTASAVDGRLRRALSALRRRGGDES